MEVIEFGPLTPERRNELEGDELDPFDGAGDPLCWRPKDRHVGLRDESEGLVASTGLLLAEVEAGAERFDVVGIGGVIVRRSHRGRGLARDVVEAALAHARTLGPAFALLFCREDRAGLYRKLGFAQIETSVEVRQPDGYARMHQLSMWRALRDRARWPPGRVVVHTLPF